MEFLSNIKGALNLGNDHEDYIAYTKQNKLRFINLNDLSEVTTPYANNMFIYYDEEENFGIYGTKSGILYKLNLNNFQSERISKKLRLPCISPVIFTSNYFCCVESYSNELCTFCNSDESMHYFVPKDIQIYDIAGYDEERILIQFRKRNQTYSKIGIFNVLDKTWTEINFNQNDVNTLRSMEYIDDLGFMIFLTVNKLMILSHDFEVIKTIYIAEYTNNPRAFIYYTYNRIEKQILFHAEEGKLYTLNLSDMSIKYVGDIYDATYMHFSHKHKILAINNIEKNCVTLYRLD